jgi:hypothetical protein
MLILDRFVGLQLNNEKTADTWFSLTADRNNLLVESAQHCSGPLF